MAPNISSVFPSEVSATKATGSLQCSHFSNMYFDTVNSSATYWANFGLNSLLSVFGVLGNTLAFLAIRKISSLHKPSKVLLGSLVLTDLGVGAMVQPSYMSYLYTKVSEGLSRRSCRSAEVANVFASTLACASFMTLTAISVDRYIALYYDTRYRSIVTTTRAFLAVGVVWSVSLLWGTSWQWCFLCHYPICIAIMAFCIPMSSFSYLKIFLGLRQRQKQRKKHLGPHNQEAAKLAKYRSSTISMLIVYVLLLLCYTPYLCTVLLVELDGISIYRLSILEYVSTLTFFNSTLNPFVYCWRIKELRRTLLSRARKFCRCRRDRLDSSTGVPRSGRGFASSRLRRTKVTPVQQDGKGYQTGFPSASVKAPASQKEECSQHDMLSTINLSH